MKKLLFPLLAAALASKLPAQVEHKHEWQATREIQAAAPPPPRLEGRIAEFDNRNSPEAIRSLAEQLFGLMDANHTPEDAEQAGLYLKGWEEFRAGKFAEALESYKKFSFAKIRKPESGVDIKPADPSKRTFIEFYNTPEELMRGVFRFQVFDKPFPKSAVDRGTDAMINHYRAGKHNTHMVDVVLQNGQPGRMNWTYVVPGFFSGTWHIRDEKGFAAVAYNSDMCFTPLLAAYLEKKDPAFLNQWIGYTEDQLLNYRRDLAEAGIRMPVQPAGAGGTNRRHLEFLVLNAPDIDRDFPATTWARIQLRQWLWDLPLIMLGSRATGANRAMHMYGALLTDARMRYPELKFSDTLLEERRRILESYAHEYMMADGTSIDYAPNYNKNFINCPPADVQFFSKMKNPPAWFTPRWIADMDEDRGVMAGYLIRSIAPDGSLPGYKDPLRNLKESTLGKNGYLAKFFPQSLEAPPNKAVVSNLLAKAGVEDPGFKSEAFPYGAYYIMRENWDPSGRYLYFHDYRPGENGNWSHHKNIFVQAFGQRMLTAFRWESPLLVDGAGHINIARTNLYPERYNGQRGLFGSHAERRAWQDPQPNRWHTSGQFDFAEGNLKIPFAERFEDDSSVFVDDVAHGRQVVYLRDAGAWIVTDSIRAEKPHDYQVLWGFEPAIINPPGWERDWRTKNRKIEPPRADAYTKEQIVTDPEAGAIRTTHPERPNLSIFHTASLPVTLTPGEILQADDAMYGNAYRAGPKFHSTGDALLASLLYPRNTGAPDLALFSPVTIKDGAGFDAKTPEGVAISYRASLTPQKLAAGNINATAAGLVVSQKPGKPASGLVLDGSSFEVDGKRIQAPAGDFEFTVENDGGVVFKQIYRPMPRVRILPEQNIFVGSLDVTLESQLPDVQIRYTLDGSNPTHLSPLYTHPIRLTESTEIRASAFRKDLDHTPLTGDSTLASIPSVAHFTKADSYLPALKTASFKPGLAFRHYEDDWTLSVIKLPILKPASQGIAKEWMDISSRPDNGKCYAFVYEGFLKVPENGIYTFHAPPEFVDVGERAGYDLRLEVGGKEWYPGARTHAYGSWSLPLAAGAHPIRLTYVDIRPAVNQATIAVSFDGKRPEFTLSGPGLAPQPVPAGWLVH